MKHASTNEAEESTKASVTSKSRKIGRPMHRFTAILRDFTRSNGIAADRENFYIFMVRAVIKSIKFTIKDKTLKPVGFTFNIRRPELLSLKGKIKSCLAEYDFHLDKQAKKRIYQLKFIRDFFRVSCHQSIFSVITDLMLLDQNFSVLCQRFNIFCCRCETHSEPCGAKWTAFRDYLWTDFVHDLVDAEDEVEDKIFGVLDLV